MRLRTDVLLATCLLTSAAWGQNSSGNDPATTGVDRPSPKAFDAVFAEWKNAIRELQAMRIRFQAATEAEQPAMQARYQELYRNAKAIQPQWIAAAKDAYAAAPNQDQAITELLVEIVHRNTFDEQYEDVVPIAKVLVEGRVADPTVLLCGGLAAFVTNDYPEAERIFEAARAEGVLGKPLPNDHQDLLRVAQLAAVFATKIDEYKSFWKQEQEILQAEAQADDLPRVKLETNRGEIVIELFENEAPNTVANFISLVEDGFYNGSLFHRVLPGFMAQGGGGPNGSPPSGPGYSIACECHQANFRRHFRGTLSMAHAGRDSGGSQFFLTFVPTGHLDGQHTAFGRVVQGMDVLGRITRNPEEEGRQADKIIQATVLRKRDHDYEPSTTPLGSF